MPFDNPNTDPPVQITHRSEQELLDEMRRLLRTPSNWVKGCEESHGRFCLLGAIRAAPLDWPDYHRELIETEVWDRLTEVVGKEVIDFNDDPKTRHRDIVSALTRARASFE